MRFTMSQILAEAEKAFANVNWDFMIAIMEKWNLEKILQMR